MVDLDSQFSRRSHDQCRRGSDRFAKFILSIDRRPVIEEMANNGQKERGSLARSRLGTSQQVTTSSKSGNGITLDWSRLVVFGEFAEVPTNPFMQTGGLEEKWKDGVSLIRQYLHKEIPVVHNQAYLEIFQRRWHLKTICFDRYVIIFVEIDALLESFSE